MKKINYTIEYNSTTKTWCLFKNISSDRSFNFYTIAESNSKKEIKEIKDKVLSEV